MLMLDVNQLSAAKEAYERVLRTTPDHSKVLQHLGGIYLRENTPFHDPEKCIAYITQSLEHGQSPCFHTCACSLLADRQPPIHRFSRSVLLVSARPRFYAAQQLWQSL